MSAQGKAKTPAPAASSAPNATVAKEVKSPRERMTSVGTTRVNNVLEALRILENVSDRAVYEYTDPEADKIMSAVKGATDKVIKRFMDVRNGVKVVKAQDGFTL